MKRSVDLTDNEVFRPENQRTFNIRGNINIGSAFLIRNISKNNLSRKIKKCIADIPYCIDNDIEHLEKGAIIQGDKNRRKYYKATKQDFYCERCGRDKKYFWEDFSQGLCPECSDAIRERSNYERFKNRYKNN